MTKPEEINMAAAAKATSASSLDDRIADAFQTEMSSHDLKALLDEVERTSADAQVQSKEAEARALDPKLRLTDVASAREQMQDAEFRSKRMEAAARQLEGLRSQAVAREQREHALAEYEAAKAERDQLARDLGKYSSLAKEIAILLQRLAASNQRISAVGRAVPGKEPLQSAEVLTRGAAVGTDPWFPSLLSGTTLPSWQKGDGNMGYIWARGQS